MSEVTSVAEVTKQLIDSLTKIAETHGPAAGELALKVVTIEAIQFLAIGFFFLFVAVPGLSYAAYHLFSTGCEIIESNKGKSKYDPELRSQDPYMLGGCLCLLLILLSSLPVLVNLLNIYNWYAIFDPKVVLAKQIMDKLL